MDEKKRTMKITLNHAIGKNIIKNERAAPFIKYEGKEKTFGCNRCLFKFSSKKMWKLESTSGASIRVYEIQPKIGDFLKTLESGEIKTLSPVYRMGKNRLYEPKLMRLVKDHLGKEYFKTEYVMICAVNGKRSVIARFSLPDVIQKIAFTIQEEIIIRGRNGYYSLSVGPSSLYIYRLLDSVRLEIDPRRRLHHENYTEEMEREDSEQFEDEYTRYDSPSFSVFQGDRVGMGHYVSKPPNFSWLQFMEQFKFSDDERDRERLLCVGKGTIKTF